MRRHLLMISAAVLAVSVLASGQGGTGPVIGRTAAATWTAVTAFILGTADTAGVRLDLESGTMAVREGDDSAYAPMKALSGAFTSALTVPTTMTGVLRADSGVVSVDAAVLPNEVVGVASGYKIARVSMALDGGNPTSWTHGLTSAVACNVTLVGTAAPGIGTSIITHNINGAAIDIYAWKVTSAIDDTLIASTGTETVQGMCVGT